MNMFLTVVHVIICIALIVVVMMQRRKSGGFSGSFGGGGTQADMSGGAWQRMSGLTKITTVLLAVFMLLSLAQVVIR